MNELPTAHKISLDQAKLAEAMERPIPLSYLSEYPVTLAQWHWNMNGVPTPIAGDTPRPVLEKDNE